MEQDFEQNFDKMGLEAFVRFPKVRGEKFETENRRNAGQEFFLSNFHIQLKGQVFDRNQWNFWSFASLGILSLHVPSSSMAWKSVALPYDCKM